MFSKELKEKIKRNSNLRILLYFLVLFLLHLCFLGENPLESDVAVGSIWIQDDLIASMPFEILKDPETYRIEKLRAAESVYQVFEIDQIRKNICY